MALSPQEELELLELEEQEYQASKGKVTPQETVSALESGARGLVQGASLGFGDEIQGGAEALWEKAFSGDQTALADLYNKHRDSARSANQAAQDANPASYMGGQAAGAVGLGLATGGTSSIGGLAALGAAEGLGSSNADLTQGDYLGAAKDTAIGGALGGALGVAGKQLSNLAPKAVPLAKGALEEIATNPILGKVGQSGPVAMSNNIIKSPAAQAALKYLPIGKDIIDNKALQLGGQITGRVAAYSHPGTAAWQGISDVAKVAQKSAQITLEHIIPRMGKFAPYLQSAAARGKAALAATDFVLQQTNPEYQAAKKQATEEGGERVE